MTRLMSPRAETETEVRSRPVAAPPSRLATAVRVFGPLTLFLTAIWAGLVTANLELFVFWARWRFVDRTALSSLQLNQYAPWMVPLSDALIFSLAGLSIAVVAWLTRSRWAVALGIYGLCFLSAYALLLSYRGLSTLACSALAIGLAFRISGPILRRPEAFRRSHAGFPAGLAGYRGRLVGCRAGLRTDHRADQSAGPSGFAERPVHRAGHRPGRELEPPRLRASHVPFPRGPGAQGRLFRPGEVGGSLDAPFARHHVHGPVAARVVDPPGPPARRQLPDARRVPARPRIRHGGLRREHVLLQPMVRVGSRLRPLRGCRDRPGRDRPDLGPGPCVVEETPPGRQRSADGLLRTQGRQEHQRRVPRVARPPAIGTPVLRLPELL